MEHFIDDEEGYDRWVQAHPRGIVLNAKGAGRFTVHTADCDHIAWFGPRTGTAGQWEYTKGGGKRCFAERHEALAWIAEHSSQTTDCRDCAPGFAPRRPGSRPPSQPRVAPPEPGVVREGSHVTVEDEDGETSTYRIGVGSIAAGVDRALSVDSPVARAVLEARVGDVVDVRTPGGSYVLHVRSVVDPGDVMVAGHRRQA